MKNLFLLLCCILVVGCAFDKKESQPPVGMAPANAANAEVLKQQFLPIIEGVWVTSDYIEEIKRTKSPYMAHPKLRGIADMHIVFDATTDSLVIGIDRYNHEGNSLILHLQKGRTPNSLLATYLDYDNKDDSFEIGYSLTPKDTLLFVYHYNKSGELLHSRQYTRISKTAENYETGWGIQLVANKELIAGTYVIEGTAPPITVTFTEDGRVTGFDDFESYLVGTDFAVNDPDEIPGHDYIYFIKKGNDINNISSDFKVTGNTLVLSHQSTYYKLVKQ